MDDYKLRRKAEIVYMAIVVGVALASVPFWGWVFN